ncbi:methionine ABC transporter ATP-binding protein [Bacillus sp. FJAT-50079]|uniref:methionine ABC transporter ATP-binding protein n=1 Tax=Bacillus sp. FJAT-50079 TaxID=2833577 RepID=UPI001BC9D1C4|nr:methionine ABC transporter ATP-binding protein [Bacillus sp. FJAT-50079]MBS4207016.1 methionine ABC transporter ATP-binding protein [Bacillus sp. FJAT-50079]
MIELKDVYKTYMRNGISNEALRGVSLQVEKGDIFGVIGYSGAGKSTLIRMVNCLEQPTSGQVFVNGEPLDRYSVKELRQVKKKIGMIFQHFNLLETKTVFDNIAIPLVLLKRNKAEIRERVMELLQFVGLSDKEKSYPKELSGGQKQRVGIARALASNPSILLCDEATSALDPQTTQSILELLKKINEEYNITIMMITHEMGVIQKVCNKVAVMEKGKIVEQGKVLDVFGNPQHSTTQSFVQTVMQNEIPNSVLKTLTFRPNRRLFRLKFVGGSASQPILSSLIRQYDLEVNTLFANMTEIQGTTIGTMIIELHGDDSVIDKAALFLEDLGVHVEEEALV